MMAWGEVQGLCSHQGQGWVKTSGLDDAALTFSADPSSDPSESLAW